MFVEVQYDTRIKRLKTVKKEEKRCTSKIFFLAQTNLQQMIHYITAIVEQNSHCSGVHSDIAFQQLN